MNLIYNNQVDFTDKITEFILKVIPYVMFDIILAESTLEYIIQKNTRCYKKIIKNTYKIQMYN